MTCIPDQNTQVYFYPYTEQNLVNTASEQPKVYFNVHFQNRKNRV